MRVVHAEPVRATELVRDDRAVRMCDGGIVRPALRDALAQRSLYPGEEKRVKLIRLRLRVSNVGGVRNAARGGVARRRRGAEKDALAIVGV